MSDGASGNLRAGERRTVSIVVSDLVGFSELSEQLDPEDTDRLMSRVFGTYTDIVARNGGTVEKYIGDAMVSVFGVPEVQEEDAQHAVTSALEFHRWVSETRVSELLGHEVPVSPDRQELLFRTAVHTGLIATGKRGTYNVVTGHAMTVANRVQSAASPGAILVTRATRNRVGPAFRFGDELTLELKGVDEPVVAYPVEDTVPDAEHESGPFVGRETLVAEIVREYLRHDPAEPRGFVLRGEPGIGKTATVRQVLSRIRRFPDFNAPVLHGVARRYRTRPYALVIDLLLDAMGLERRIDSDSARRAAEALGVDRENAARFASIVSGDRSDATTEDVVVLYRLFEQLVAPSPESPYSPIVFLDNAHLLEQPSRAFFRFYFDNTSARPFFLLADRSDEAGLHGVFPDLEVRTLGPLSEDESRALVERLWTGEDRPELVPRVLRAAQGNPLFIREYLAYLQEADADEDMPGSIQNIVLARLEHLSIPRRELMTKLAVFFRNFTREDAIFMQEQTGSPTDLVDDALGDFVGSGILERRGVVYAFRHDLFKQAVYSTLLNYNKRILHRIVADRMRQQARPNTMRLIRHLLRAEDFRAAAEVLVASRTATVNPEFPAIIDELLEEERISDVQLRFQLLFTKAALLFNAGRTEPADDVLRRLLAIAVEHRSPAFLARAYHLMTGFNLQSYAFKKTLVTGRKALHYYRAIQTELQLELNLLGLMATSECLRGRTEESDSIVRRMEHLAAGSAELERTETRCSISFARAQYADCIKQADSVLPRNSNPNTERPAVAVEFRRVMAAFWGCDFSLTVESATRLTHAEPVRAEILAPGFAMAAAASRILGQERRAGELWQQAEFYRHQVGNDFGALDTLRTMAWARYLVGDHEKAGQLAMEALPLGLRHTAHYPLMSLLVILSELALEQGNAGDARFFREEADTLVGMNVLLPRRDLLLYHARMAESVPEHARIAAELLAAEEMALPGDEARRQFQVLPVFARVRGRIASLTANASGA